MPKLPYSFQAIVWQYPGPNGWHFVTLPEDLSMEIRTLLKAEEQGWGRLKAEAQIGTTRWETAIWYETKANAYLLPLKAEVRRKEKLEKGGNVVVKVFI